MKVAEGIYFIAGQDEFIPDSHVYVVGEPGSDDITLIDAGLMGKAGYKLERLESLGFEPKKIKRIIMTHCHLDHIGCLPELMEELDSPELWVHESEAQALERGDERVVYGMEMFKGMCQAQYGLRDGVFSFEVQRKLKDGEELVLSGATWKVLHIPGHSPGSIALYDVRRKILIPGDTLYADYAIGRFDLFGASGPQLKDSLMRLASLEIEVLLPGHNRILKSVPRGYANQVASQWAPYLS